MNQKEQDSPLKKAIRILSNLKYDYRDKAKDSKYSPAHRAAFAYTADELEEVIKRLTQENIRGRGG